MSEGTIKQVKVDNWGIFFLQRLQQLFAKNDHCDLVLQFNSNEKIKVHRLVLYACTDYFQALENKGLLNGDALQIPSDLQPDVVLPIINFMYTGKLEFRTELLKRLYTAAQQLNMTVLTKLLDAQNAAVTPQIKPVLRRQPLPVTYNLQGKKITPKQIDPDLPETLPGRKLPIWKRRNVPTNAPSYYEESTSYSLYDSTSKIPSTVIDETPRPTRFEWPEENTDSQPYSTSFDDLSYETRPIVKPFVYAFNKPSVPNKPETSNRVATFEEVCRTATNVKPLHSGTSFQDGRCSKKAKLDLQQQLQEEQHQLLIDSHTHQQLQTQQQMVPLPQQMKVEQFHGESLPCPQQGPLDAVEHQLPLQSTPTPVLSEPLPVTSVQIPSQTQLLTSTPIQTPHLLQSQTTVQMTPSQQTPIRQVVLPPQKSILKAQGNLSNHAKIITEVLKKYPHLVKNNKNIRLKIMQRGGAQVAPVVPMDGDASKMVKSKVSYVVLKSDVAGKGKPAVVLKHGGMVEPLSELGGQKPTSGAENTTGPWLCHSCGSNEEPIHFETYYLYRRHLQDIHMEKIDARICEHCGHRASKRNLLLYHLYTKHGVPPPRNCQFPKCDQCDYVALSESLLIKHRNSHSNNKEFVCKVCNAAFKSNGALQGHMQTNLHSDPAKKLYECPFCQKPFVRNINLKAHIRTSHKEVIRKIDEEERLLLEGKEKEFGSLQQFEDGEEGQSSDAILDESLNTEGEEEGELMEVPVIDAVMPKPGTGTVMLPSGVTVLAEAPAVQSLVPSSEAEALSNVASGIAASLALNAGNMDQTVIVLDENHEFILHSTEVVGEETTSTEGKDETTVGTELQEYIVPDIMPEDTQKQTDADPSYASSLPDLEHYSEEPQGHSTITVSPSIQTTTAPPPVSVAVSVVGGDEVTMVLTDHDYAPLRDSSGEGVMLFIARPPDETESVGGECSVAASESELSMLKGEQEPPQLTAENSEPIEEVKLNSMPVLIRESADPTHIETGLNEQLTSETNETIESTSGIPLLPNETLSQEVQLNTMEETNEVAQVCESMEVVEAVPQQFTDEERLRITETVVPDEIVSQSQEIQEVNEVVDSDQIMDAAVNTPIKSTAHSPVRRQPPVQMAELMKEWEDMDEDGDEDHSAEICQEGKSNNASEEEPKILRGPVCEN
ncbi:hypothetical protein C0J52_12903 [Blattella germanica]|nr:hypothetical protein C0J52_12903 [Blattella germanica]